MVESDDGLSHDKTLDLLVDPLDRFACADERARKRRVQRAQFERAFVFGQGVRNSRQCRRDLRLSPSLVQGFVRLGPEFALALASDTARGERFRLEAERPRFSSPKRKPIGVGRELGSPRRFRNRRRKRRRLGATGAERFEFLFNSLAPRRKVLAQPLVHARDLEQAVPARRLDGQA